MGTSSFGYMARIFLDKTSLAYREERSHRIDRERERESGGRSRRREPSKSLGSVLGLNSQPSTKMKTIHDGGYRAPKDVRRQHFHPLTDNKFALTCLDLFYPKYLGFSVQQPALHP